MDYILETEKLTKVYSRKKVVNEVSLQINKGAIYGLIGKNGSGKTTIIRMITGLAEPTSGKISFSKDFAKPGMRAKISAVIEPALFTYMSAAQNMETQRLALGVRDKSVIKRLLDLVGLGDAGSKKVKDFSLGMRQRLAIAVALVGDPEFLFLDEPINGLDPIGIRDIRDMINSLSHENGVTVMISSHILSELTKVATNYGVINSGELVKQFSSEELESSIKGLVVVKVNDVQRAVTAITEELGLNEYQIEENELKIHVRDGVGVSEINSVLAKNDVIVESISSNSNDYEGYFIKLMEGSSS
ncbi:MAG: ATP-binding cassette domain-containing protein [Oscillospiraceae bacterium]|jgi:ABC-2 type transport system ATP-binding protein|nr:ATP-binding cassette domain-containing protein [Oscillospiraceae bacterium]